MRDARRARLVLTTAGDEAAAARIGRALVERRLSACVNIVPRVRSVYRWQGELHDEGETLLVIKTVEERLGELERALGELHPYDVPELLVLPVERGAAAYLDWLEAETASEPDG